jgi:AraC family transcriptional regulator, melibiose operon regulatory protein
MEIGSLIHAAAAGGNCHPRAFAYYFKQWNGFRMPLHRHNSTEIMYAISGSCRVDVQTERDGRAESVTLKKGEFIVLDANVPHRLIVEEGSPCRMLNVEFGFVRTDASFPTVRELADGDLSMGVWMAEPFSYIVLRDPDELYHVLKSLVLELDGGGKSETMIQLLFAQLLIRISRLRQEAAAHGAKQSDYYVLKAIDFLHQNYDRDIQIRSIASAVNLHPGYLQRIFKAHERRTITEYLTALRMEKAKMLLAQTDIPVIEISGYVGVSSRQYFHMLFKKYAGCTPMEYRNAAKAERRSYFGESENF